MPNLSESRDVLTGQKELVIMFKSAAGARIRTGASASWLEVARTVHAQVAAQFEHLFATTGNPLWVWRFMVSTRGIRNMLEHLEPQPDIGTLVQPLPQWCVDYLLQSAQRLAYLADGLDYRSEPVSRDKAKIEEWLRDPRIEPTRAGELVADALGLTRAGWNAFAAFQVQKRDDVGVLFLDYLSEKGESKAKLIEKLAEIWAVEDTRQLRRRLSAARKRVNPRG
jgi:hypothetical protein